MSPMARCRSIAQFGAPPLEAVVEFVEVRLRLRDVAFEAAECSHPQCGDSARSASDSFARWISSPSDISRCRAIATSPPRGTGVNLFKEWIERFLDQGLLHACAIGYVDRHSVPVCRLERKCQFGEDT